MLKSTLSSKIWSRSYLTFFLRFFFFGVKLGHFTINNVFLCVMKTQDYQRKTEKFLGSEEKKFGRIDSSSQFREHFTRSLFASFHSPKNMTMRALQMINDTLEQGCTAQISWRAKKVLLKYSRARLVNFFLIF